MPARSRRLSALVGTGALLLSGVAAAGLAPPAEGAQGSQHVIVLLKNQLPGAPAGHRTISHRVTLAARTQAPLVATARRDGAHGFRRLHVVNGFAATMSATAVARLRNDPAVAEVVPDRLIAKPTFQQDPPSSAAPGPVASTTCPTDPASPLLEPEALQLTHTAFADPATPSANQVATGKGVTVAFLADGLDINNPDFIRADGSHVFADYQDFSGDGPNAPTSGGEAFGDASSIAAQGRQTYDLATYVNAAHPLPAGCTIRVQGMAPGASLVGLKIFPAGGFAFNSALLAALDWAVTHDHADVINESFGSNQYPDTNDDPTAMFNEQLIRGGVTVVASSGDAGPENTIGSPASSPGVIAVGGTTSFRSYAQTTESGFQLSNGTYRSNAISGLSSAGFTQPGRTIDLVAPGDLGWALCTPDPARFAACRDDGGRPSPIEEFGGTSQSAPFVAGAAALVIQAYRDAHAGASPAPDLVRRLLTSTADDLGLPAQLQGAGLLDTLRAVHAAQSVAGGAGATGASGDLLASTNQLDLTAAPGGLARARLSVTNLSTEPELVTAAPRSSTKVLATTDRTVALSAATDQTFVDGRGTARAFTRTPLTVPAGADHLRVSIAWANPAALVRITLLDPTGAYAGYSIPQGTATDFGTVDVPQPVAGDWTVVLWTAASAAGFTGNVQLHATSAANEAAGVGLPAAFVLQPGQTRPVSFLVRVPRDPGDAADALVLKGRPVRGGDATSTVVPIVVRTLVPLSRRGAEFSGALLGGNGRGGIPNPSQTYAFDVPRRAESLGVHLTVTGDPGQAIYAFLVDPNGEAVSERTNQRADAAGDVSVVPGIDLVHQDPQAGRWQLVFAVFGPVAGTATSTPYRVRISLDGADVSTSRRLGTRLPAGRPTTLTLRFRNPGAADASYFVDARAQGRTTLPLVVDNPTLSFTDSVAPGDPFPAIGVPTETDSFTTNGQADKPINFEVSPFPADHAGDLAFEGDPDRVGGPVGLAPSVTVSDPIVAPQTWLALPSAIGPFDDAGAGPVNTSFTATAHTRGFDPAVTSSTGDVLLSYVDANAAAATPVTVAAGARGTVTVTVTPTAPVGTTVRGTLYLDTFDAVTGSTDEVAAIPYRYRVTR